MRALMVLAKTLSMVSDDDDHRFLQQAFFPEALQNPADQVIRIGDLSVVEAVFLSLILSLVGLGRLIWSVGVIEVDPAEKPGRRVLLEPVKKCLNDFPALPLDGIQADLLVLGEIEIVVIIIETLIDAPAGIKDEGTDKGAGGPPP